MKAQRSSYARRQGREAGLVLLTVLVFILVTTLASSSLVIVYKTQMQREKEEELLFVGDQFRRAITSYYNTVPAGGVRALPQSLDELVNDARFPMPVQHLRRIYADPMTGQANWELVSPTGGILGVRSRSTKESAKKSGFGPGFEEFEGKQGYAEWIFVARTPQ